MGLAPGTRLGAYEVTAQIGEGGMGQVFRATDTKLKRQVALKILPPSLAADPERLARFQREAEVLASLNHPHIAGIYGLEEGGGLTALVMELVEGEDLSQRIARGPIPLDEALPIVKQIAEALEAAHEQGIVHRDLKPANIKVRPDGTVKVLDFGLAKALEPAAVASGHMSMAPTITTPAMTQAGIILGTAAYMSPEQARGQSADRRSDIWSFGVVLFEMLTGTRLFGGDSTPDVLASVLKTDVDWAALPAATPTVLRTLLRHSLTRDGKHRLQAIGDARIVIEECLAHPREAATTTSPHHRRERLAWSVAAFLFVVAVAALVLGGWAYYQSVPADTRTTRFVVLQPETWRLANYQGFSPAPLTMSPDGRSLAFVAQSSSGGFSLWVRSLDTLTAQQLAGTDGAFVSAPFWSPDSRFLGFFAGGKLKSIEVSGGRPVTVCDVQLDSLGGGATWNRDGLIVFSPTYRSALQKVSASGGVPSAATTLSQGEAGHHFPFFLPDGRHFLYSVGPGSFFVTSLDSADRKPLKVNADSHNVVYAQGHLLFLRQGTLMAQPFDAGRLELAGEAVLIADQIESQSAYGLFAASQNGVLAYQTGTGAATRLAWFDRTGKQISVLGDPAAYDDIQLSPDGKRVAVTIPQEGDKRDIWLYEVERGLRTRLTVDPASALENHWSPDSSRLVFNSNRKGHFDLYQKDVTAGAEELLLEDPISKWPMSWSPDGRFILYAPVNPETGLDVFVLPLFGDRKPYPFLKTQFTEFAAQFSPDGRWVAYDSNESGKLEVYVAPFPGPGGKWRVSTGGGFRHRWTRGGSELVYIALDNTLMAAAVNGKGSSFEVGGVKPLFRPRIAPGRDQYDVTADGQRFLIDVLPEETVAPPITVVVNWQSGLTARER